MKKETKKHPLPHDLNYQNLCVSNEDAQNIDRRAIVELSYPSIDLMEKAGLAAADQALKIIKKCKLEHTLVFCGKGNNGGDGYVLARILHDQNHAVHCICLSSRENIKGDAAISYDNMLNSACDILHIKKAEEIENLLQRPALWVDAIFGTGIHSDI
ncbi:MAG: hypothetical protein KAI81_01800, partial [Candidatus Marinimicrobia bacterium]|nr:hypothetical protein [Candidatus Neomarinimicrobiota bacterium]